MDKRITFTRREIAAASGVSLKTIESRYRARSKAGLIPEKLREFNYEQVKALLIKANPRSRVIDQTKINLLREQLINDGFSVREKKKEATA